MVARGNEREKKANVFKWRASKAHCQLNGLVLNARIFYTLTNCRIAFCSNLVCILLLCLLLSAVLYWINLFPLCLLSDSSLPSRSLPQVSFAPFCLVVVGLVVFVGRDGGCVMAVASIWLLLLLLCSFIFCIRHLTVCLNNNAQSGWMGEKEDLLISTTIHIMVLCKHVIFTWPSFLLLPFCLSFSPSLSLYLFSSLARLNNPSSFGFHFNFIFENSKPSAVLYRL